MIQRLRCWLGYHEWITVLQVDIPEDVARGYSWRVCDCGAREYAPGYPRE